MLYLSKTHWHALTIIVGLNTVHVFGDSDCLLVVLTKRPLMVAVTENVNTVFEMLVLILIFDIFPVIHVRVPQKSTLRNCWIRTFGRPVMFSLTVKFTCYDLQMLLTNSNSNYSIHNVFSVYCIVYFCI